ncbi:MAG: hypoxanthine phosphoribosyltransferase [Chloroflexi bacterium]|nr:hypoxanthine phosphoribosyltransferase [Chloroflexota bacterium]
MQDRPENRASDEASAHWRSRRWRAHRRQAPLEAAGLAADAPALASGQRPTSPQPAPVPHRPPPTHPPRSRPVPSEYASPVPHYQVPTSHRPFAHSSEGEVAKILDFYNVKWLYEPRSFPLRWDGDRVTEMFTPDFYLPELDVYLELTTMKQSLVTAKNRKLRRLRELYPEVKARLLYRRDIHRLLAKYGFGPLVQGKLPPVEKVLLTRPEIDRRVAELGVAISREYAGQEVLLVGVLRGVFCFMADLMRQITLPMSIDFMSVSYYTGAGDEGGARVTKGLDLDLAGRHVILVEDIVDTGMTLNYLLRYLQEQNPASVKVCALLDKRVRRLVEVQVDYAGFEVPDEFLVGYGLDYLERYRNLPFIGILRPEEHRDAEGA